jgi:ABC-2 type transport system permease protein
MRLQEYGIKSDQIGSVLRGAELEVLLTGGDKKGANRDAAAAIITVLLLATMLFITLLSYGVMIMRSVLDEKASRVIEVLLCSATPDELMSGKILGVGAVGLLQVVVWGVMGIAMAKPYTTTPGLHVVPLPLMIYFAVFYLLGYLLYSAMFAAVGAAFNSSDEAQHWTFVIISPLIFACTLITPVAAAPNSKVAVITSMIPFCSPVLMYMRLAVESPPTWQIFLCFGLLIAAIYFVQRIATQIYRVGILMYGKRPTIREVYRWLSYA